MPSAEAKNKITVRMASEGKLIRWGPGDTVHIRAELPVDASLVKRAYADGSAETTMRGLVPVNQARKLRVREGNPHSVSSVSGETTIPLDKKDRMREVRATGISDGVVAQTIDVVKGVGIRDWVARKLRIFTNPSVSITSVTDVHGRPYAKSDMVKRKHGRKRWWGGEVVTYTRRDNGSKPKGSGRNGGRTGRFGSKIHNVVMPGNFVSRERVPGLGMDVVTSKKKFLGITTSTVSTTTAPNAGYETS